MGCWKDLRCRCYVLRRRAELAPRRCSGPRPRPGRLSVHYSIASANIPAQTTQEHHSRYIKHKPPLLRKPQHIPRRRPLVLRLPSGARQREHIDLRMLVARRSEQQRRRRREQQCVARVGCDDQNARVDKLRVRDLARLEIAHDAERSQRRFGGPEHLQERNQQEHEAEENPASYTRRACCSLALPYREPAG